MDSTVHAPATRRIVCILTAVDADTPKRLPLQAGFGCHSRRVTRVLEPAIEAHGRPENLRSDNGPEVPSRGITGWAED